LKFFGLEERESSADTKEDTREILFDFIENTLGIENAATKIEFQRVHRLGKPVPGKSRPIIARSFDFKTERSC